MANMGPKKICIQTAILFEILSLFQQEILVDLSVLDEVHVVKWHHYEGKKLQQQFTLNKTPDLQAYFYSAI